MATDRDVEAEGDLPKTRFRLFTRETLFDIERRIAERRAQAEDADSDEEENEPELKPNPKFEAGKGLPPSVEEVPSQFQGRPLEDLDEYYHNNKVSETTSLMFFYSKYISFHCIWFSLD